MNARLVPAALTMCALALLSSCVFLGSPQARIPVEIVAAKTSGSRLVVVLPGQGDELEDLREYGVAAAIQSALPDAEVALVELTLTYYMEGRAMQRLHEEVIAPARARGIREIYLAGASMGGMGGLMYERDHPGELSGLILMAPYMGDGDLIEEIKEAGGLSKWNAGPIPAQLTRANVPREEWRLAQTWLKNPERTRRVWLICGQSDPFYEPSQLLAAVLPRENYRTPVGGHAWRVWLPAAAEVLSEIGQ